MVELVEYLLVVLVSTIMVGFSFASYSSYASAITAAGDRASSTALSSSALEALIHGSSTVALSLKNATLACQGGIFSFSEGDYSSSFKVPASCAFWAAGLSGTFVLVFTRHGASLAMAVR